MDHVKSYALIEAVHKRGLEAIRTLAAHEAAVKAHDEATVDALEAGWAHKDIARVSGSRIADVRASQRRVRDRLAEADWSSSEGAPEPSGVS